MFKGISVFMRRVRSLHPRPLWGLLLCFCSELGGGDSSDPTTDSRASCLKKSAGE